MNIEVAQKYFNRTNDKISIIIPCYNREDTIAECLNSIFSQTVPSSLYEVICIDDCSNDNTVNILEDFESKYPDNLLLIKLDINSNGYIGKVRNIGLQYASGNYILFVDSDDKLDSHALEKLYIGAIITNAEVVVSGYNTFISNDIIDRCPKYEFIYKTNNFDHLKGLYLNEGIEGYIWGKLYLKSFLDENEISFPEDYRLAEDTLFHESILLNVKTYYVLGDCLYNYRLNPNSAWNSANTCTNLLDCFKAQLYISNIYMHNYLQLHEQLYDDNLLELFAWKMCISILAIHAKCQSYNSLEFFFNEWPNIKTKLLELFPEILSYELIQKNKRITDLFEI